MNLLLLDEHDRIDSQCVTLSDARARHLLTVLRYVECNALRARLVRRAEDWPWSSLSWRLSGSPPLELSTPPCRLPGNWVELMNQPHTDDELEAIRTCVNRQRPYGAPTWVERKARDLGLTQSLHPIGRPKKDIPRSR